MATIKIKQGTTVKLEDISAQVTCPHCNHTFNVGMKASQFRKNCRCGQVTFYFALRPAPGEINLTAQVAQGSMPLREYILKSEDIELG